MPKCARPGCDNPVKPGWFACKPDWLDLPREIRHAIFQAYSESRGNHLYSPEYTHAVRRAREFWDR